MQKQPQDAGPDLQALSTAYCPTPREESGMNADETLSSLNPHLTSSLRAALEAKEEVPTTTTTGLPRAHSRQSKPSTLCPALPHLPTLLRTTATRDTGRPDREQSQLGQRLKSRVIFQKTDF